MSSSLPQNSSIDALETPSVETGLQQANVSDAATTTATSASNEQIIDDPLMRPGPVPLVPLHNGQAGEFTVQDVTVKYFGYRFFHYDIYTVLYSVNQNDGKLRVWIQELEIDGEKTLRCPWQRLQPNEDVNVEYADLGLRELVRTPAKTGLEIDSVYIRGAFSQYPSYGAEEVAVAVLVRTLETPQELEATRVQRGLRGLWMKQEEYEAGTEDWGFAFNDEALYAAIVNGFEVLELIRNPPEPDEDASEDADFLGDLLDEEGLERTCRARLASLASRAS